MKTSYTITVKPLEPKGDLSFYEVTPREASQIQQRWDSHQNIQIGSLYISWQRILEIQAPPKNNQLEAGSQWCDNCERGWLFNAQGAYPCTCNANGKENVTDYFNYLEKQSWYTR